MEISTYKQITTWAAELDGVFTLPDLKIAFNGISSPSIYREIESLIEAKDLVRVKRGYYATVNTKLSTIAARLYPKSYISTGTALAAYRIIGSVPERRVQVVGVGTPTITICSLGTIEFLSIAPKLFFGFERNENANWATAEKAYLDCCYYFYKGKTFSFDLTSDVNRTILDPKKIERHLVVYDKRFITFFRNQFWRVK